MNQAPIATLELSGTNSQAHQLVASSQEVQQLETVAVWPPARLLLVLDDLSASVHRGFYKTSGTKRRTRFLTFFVVYWHGHSTEALSFNSVPYSRHNHFERLIFHV